MKKRNVLAALTLIFGLLSASLAAQTRAAPDAEKPLPNLSLKKTDGTIWNLEDERGNVVVLNFWATWCAPCREEIPALVALNRKYKTEKVSLVGVAVDSENTEAIDSFIREFRLDYPIVLAVPGSLLSQQKALPMTLLIDERGVLAKKYVGAVKLSVLEKDVKNLIGKKEAQ